jgi:hypothetical protein
VFVIGCCKYKGSKKADWDLATRQDTVFVDTLRARGVPAENIVMLLDAAATLHNIKERFAAHLLASRPDETLLFYFDGHGCRGEEEGNAGSLQFCQYDCDDAGALPAADVFTAIERYFRGSTALLLADCCYSGFLALEAPRRAGRVSYGVLTSQMASQTSTGQWTFTTALVAGFAQRLAVDLSGDGVLTFSELATYMEALLAREAGQLCMRAEVNGFPATYILGSAEARGPRAPPATDGVVYPPGSRIRVNAPAGDAEEGSVLGATVLAVRRGIHLVRLDGRGELLDTWVGPDEIDGCDELAAEATGGAAAAAGAASGGSFVVGQRVRAKWPDEASYPGWFPGTVTAVATSYGVLYDDGDEAEVVEPHIRALPGASLAVGRHAQALWCEGTDPDYKGWFGCVIKAATPAFGVRYEDGTSAYVGVDALRVA